MDNLIYSIYMCSNDNSKLEYKFKTIVDNIINNIIDHVYCEELEEVYQPENAYNNFSSSPYAGSPEALR